MKVREKSSLYCLISAIVFITICSKSSFLYPMNDWGDVGCYYVLGKGMLSGMVPYKDYFEQKGIVIYALYAIGILLSKTSFFGVYLIEIICMTLFLIIALKIMALFIDIENHKFVIPFFLASCICSSAFFCHGGSPEELLLPVFVYGLYVGIRYFEKDELPNKVEMFVFGICAGLLFFSKYTLCIFYLSIIFFILIKAIVQKKTRELFKNTLMFLLGCFITIVPVIIYFVAEDAMSDFFYVYFYKSIFSYIPEKEYANLHEVLKHYLHYATFFFRKRNILIILLLGLGETWLVIKKKYFLALFQIFTFVSFYYLEFMKIHPRKYYGLPLAIFSIFGVCATIDFVSRRKIKIATIGKSFIAIFFILVSIVFTDNRYYMFKNKNSIPQYIFAKEMESYDYKDYHLLYYGPLDQGYYFASNTLPNCRAFVQLNLLGDELINIQNDHIDNRKCEFIVSQDVLCDSKQYDEYRKKYGEEENIVAFDNFGYEMIDEVDNYFEEKYFKVRLYKIKD